MDLVLNVISPALATLARKFLDAKRNATNRRILTADRARHAPRADDQSGSDKKTHEPK